MRKCSPFSFLWRTRRVPVKDIVALAELFSYDGVVSRTLKSTFTRDTILLPLPKSKNCKILKEQLHFHGFSTKPSYQTRVVAMPLSKSVIFRQKTHRHYSTWPQRARKHSTIASEKAKTSCGEQESWFCSSLFGNNVRKIDFWLHPLRRVVYPIAI